MFVKLFSSLLDSTMWTQPPHVLRLWITVLLLADKDGYFDMPVPALARRAGVTYQECQEALAILEGPDPESRSKDEEGRRIIREADDGPTWKIVNYIRYRQLRHAEDRRAYNRERQREYRKHLMQKNAEGVAVCSTMSHDVAQCSTGVPPCTHAEAEAEVDTKTSAPTVVGDAELLLIPPSGDPQPKRVRKERVPHEAHKVIEEWVRGATERLGVPSTVANYGQATDAAKRLIKTYGLEVACGLAYEFGADPPKQNRDRGYLNFENIERTVNALLSRRKEEGR